MKTNKKGNIDDIGFSIYVWVPIGIIFVLSLFVFTEMNDKVQNYTGGIGFTDESKNFLNVYQNNFSLAVDGSFGLLVVGMIILSIMLATKIQTSPIFILISTIYMIIVWTLSWIMANFWDTFSSSNAQLYEFINTLYVIPYILNHLVPITLIYSLFLMIAVYLKEQ